MQVSIQADSVDGSETGYDAYETFDHSVPAPNPPNPDANGIRYLPVGDIPANASVIFDAYYNAVQQGSFMRNFFLTLSDAQMSPILRTITSLSHRRSMMSVVVSRSWRHDFRADHDRRRLGYQLQVPRLKPGSEHCDRRFGLRCAVH